MRLCVIALTGVMHYLCLSPHLLITYTNQEIKLEKLDVLKLAKRIAEDSNSGIIMKELLAQGNLLFGPVENSNSLYCIKPNGKLSFGHFHDGRFLLDETYNHVKVWPSLVFTRAVTFFSCARKLSATTSAWKAKRLYLPICLELLDMKGTRSDKRTPWVPNKHRCYKFCSVNCARELLSTSSKIKTLPLS